MSPDLILSQQIRQLFSCQNYVIQTKSRKNDYTSVKDKQLQGNKTVWFIEIKAQQDKQNTKFYICLRFDTSSPAFK